MNKENYEELLSIAMSTGADFAEVYFEDKEIKTYTLNDSKLDSISSANTKGIGIRIIKEDKYYYSSTNNLSMDNLRKIVKKLANNIKNQKKIFNVKLNEICIKKPSIKINHNDMLIDDKKSKLKSLDSIVRNKFKEISQVVLAFKEEDSNVIIANSNGQYINNNKIYTRFTGTIYTQKGDTKESEFFAYGAAEGYEFLKNLDLEKEILSTAKSAVEKLDAVDFEGGEVPVVIANGFGAVIFHEACGHGLEATSVAPKISIFSDLKNKKIGTDKVTLIDDGTIENVWGSSLVDDEGNETHKNILIENGILKNYLIDKYGSIILGMPTNGCGRRENYDYAPTSRMSNTYLAPGHDKIEDMFKSIDYGVYCKKLSGGTVNPATGDFNFAVDNAYLIEKGIITKQLRGVTLIGNGKEILNQVEMVGDDLKLSDGYCGSKSGFIPVTIGQPTIKISKILVGGKQ